MNIHKNLIYSLFSSLFHFCFPFHFSELNQNNLYGTITTEIGLMSSLGFLWEQKKKKKMKIHKIWFNLFIFFHHCFPFILVILIKTIFMGQFQLKLDCWLHWDFCEKKKRRKKWTIHKNLIRSFFLLSHLFFLSF